MKHKRRSNLPLPTPVLRNVVMHTQPHALLRPGWLPPGQSMKVQAMPLSTSLAAWPVEALVMSEQAFSEGRKEGYLAGRADEKAEGQSSLQSAMDDARARGYEDGRVEGVQAGTQQAERELKQAAAQAIEHSRQLAQESLARLDQMLLSIASQSTQWWTQAEDDLLALSHEAVCLILGAEAVKPEAVRSIVRFLLARHGQRAKLAVHVHPGDFEALVAQGLDAAAPDPWRWIPDNQVQLGGVILRSPEGSLDARLDTQIAALTETLREVRRSRRDAIAGVAVPPAQGVTT